MAKLLSDAIDEYVADRKARGKSANTRRQEASVLRRMLATIGNVQVHNITPQMLDKFWLRNQHWSPATFNLTRALLNGFFQWCRIRRHMPRTHDPLEGTTNQRKQKVPRSLVPQSRFDEMLGLAKSPRERMLFACGLYLFTRVSETTSIRRGDLDFDNHTVDVYRSKTGDADTLPMSTELEHELRRWRLAYAELAGEVPKPDWYLIPAFSTPLFIGGVVEGQPLQRDQQIVPTRPAGYDTARKAVKSALEQMGLWQEGEGSHTLRRSGAAALYRRLGDEGHDRAIRMCQAMLGHANITTTEIYLRLDVDRKQRNDMLAGLPMFPPKEVGVVVNVKFGEEQAQ